MFLVLQKPNPCPFTRIRRSDLCGPAPVFPLRSRQTGAAQGLRTSRASCPRRCPAHNPSVSIKNPGFQVFLCVDPWGDWHNRRVFFAPCLVSRISAEAEPGPEGWRRARETGKRHPAAGLQTSQNLIGISGRILLKGLDI